MPFRLTFSHPLSRAPDYNTITKTLCQAFFKTFLKNFLKFFSYTISWGWSHISTTFEQKNEGTKLPPIYNVYDFYLHIILYISFFNHAAILYSVIFEAFHSVFIYLLSTHHNRYCGRAHNRRLCQNLAHTVTHAKFL